MLNRYEICLDTANYLIFNNARLQILLCISILDCFGQSTRRLSTETYINVNQLFRDKEIEI